MVLGARVGYGIFEQVKMEEVAITSNEVQESLQDLQRFSKMVKLKCTSTKRSRSTSTHHHNETCPRPAATPQLNTYRPLPSLNTPAWRHFNNQLYDHSVHAVHVCGEGAREH